MAHRLPTAALLVLAALACSASWLRAQARPETPSAAQVQAWAARIDEFVARGLARHDQVPNPIADDQTFLRRAYLQIVGRVPSAAEAGAFLASPATDRRDLLIDQLLESPGRISHEVGYWTDLFRAKSRLQNRVSGEPFLHYLRACVADGVPYDRMVREMLTAAGPAHARDNGATGYLLRDLGMPEDSMANTLRVFLGTRMECAQCHDHPFDRWKQREFFEMAAFAGGLQYRATELQGSEVGRELAAITRQARQQENGRQLAQAVRRIVQPLAVGLSGSGTGMARLPDDYRGDDLRPGSFVPARPIFGEQVDLPEARPTRPARARARPQNRRAPQTFAEIDSRQAFAQWLTSPANPRFTKVIANRMWQRCFGIGLIEPVDDIREDTTASDPELMAYLEQLMIELRYDLREFQRVLLKTQTWQRRAGVHDDPDAEPYRFPGPALRRLSAEQLWDSLLTLTLDDVDSTIARPGARAERVYAQYDEIAGLSGDQLRELLDREMLRFTDPPAYRRALAAERARAREMNAADERPTAARVRELTTELRRARQQRDAERVRALTEELRTLRRPQLNQRGLVRASELPSPAPAGHFLREFGQSDREQVDGAFDDANVPQVLSLMNGIVDRQLLDRRSALARQLAATEGEDQLVRAAFLAVLTRAPTPGELTAWRAPLRENRERAAGDLVWTLCNSDEFRFLQ